MNDQFLYQLRTDPPPHFAAQLKDRLNRGPTRKTRVLGFGLGFLLIGSAFAMVSPAVRMSIADMIDWIRDVPAPTAEIPQEVNRGLARAFGDRKIEAPAPPVPGTEADRASEVAAREGAKALLGEKQALPRGLVERGPRWRASDNVTETAAADEARAEASADGSPDAPRQSSFIVTGPLLPEQGMPSYVFDARRAYFTVLRMTTDPFMPLLERGAPPDLQVAQTSARRLELLASMMAEMFAKDERHAAWAVPTRSRPQIWERPEEFGRAIDAFTAATRALSTSIGSRDPGQLRTRFLKVEYACAKCHEKFRRGGNDNVGAVSP